MGRQRYPHWWGRIYLFSIQVLKRAWAIAQRKLDHSGFDTDSWILGIIAALTPILDTDSEHTLSAAS